MLQGIPSLLHPSPLLVDIRFRSVSGFISKLICTISLMIVCTLHMYLEANICGITVEFCSGGLHNPPTTSKILNIRIGRTCLSHRTLSWHTHGVPCRKVNRARMKNKCPPIGPALAVPRSCPSDPDGLSTYPFGSTGASHIFGAAQRCKRCESASQLRSLRNRFMRGQIYNRDYNLASLADCSERTSLP